MPYPTRTSRTLSLLAALVTASAVILTGCGGAGGGKDGEAARTPSATPTPAWGGWTTLKYGASVVAATADRAVIFNHDKQRLDVFDHAGKKLWTVPGGVGDDQFAHVVAGPGALYARQNDASIVALDWKSGQRLWKFDPQSISDCYAPDSLDVGTASGGRYLRSGEPLVMSYQATADDNSDESDLPPEHCMKDNASAARVPALVGIDADSGKARWKSDKSSIIDEIYPPMSDPSGKYIFQIDSHRGYPGVTRTDTTNGKTVSTGLSVTDKGYVPGESIWLTPYSADGFVLEWSGDDEAASGEVLDAHVTKWVSAAENKQGAVGTARLSTLGGGESCKRDVFRAESSGTPFCRSEESGSYRVGAVGADGPGSTWTTAADKNVSDAGGDANPYGDDPIVTAKGTDPRIVLPTPKGSVTAFDLATGSKAWRWAPGANGPAAAGSAKAAAMSPTFVAQANQVALASGNTVLGLDSATGKQAWAKKLGGGTLGMFTATGGVLAAKVDSKSGGAVTYLRFASGS